MLAKNAEVILGDLSESDLVLDIGGWACPFNRANVVLDAEPFETRGYYKTIGMPGSQGGDREHFSRDTWIQRDICGREPWPFRDKQFDFAICSHVLEDIRDPLWVCSELIRVAKRGYIEIPSRAWETCRNIERPGIVGLSHHRWLIDISGNRIDFLPKFHAIHSHWRFSLPKSYHHGLTAEKSVQWLLWQDSFEYREVTIHGCENMDRELERFVQEVRPYPRWQITFDSCLRTAASYPVRLGRKLASVLRSKPSANSL